MHEAEDREREKFADRVNWKNIFQYQNLSDAFREKWKHKLAE